VISGQGIKEARRYAAYETKVTAGMICWSLNGCSAFPAGNDSSLLTFCGRLFKNL
jgi:hypothetical protein